MAVNKTPSNTIAQLLQKQLTPLQLRLHHSTLLQLETGYRQQTPGSVSSEEDPVILLGEYLGFIIRSEMDTIKRLKVDFDAFSAYYSRSVTDKERRQYMINYIETLEADKQQLKEDRKALNRWLGHDALQERYQLKTALSERQICFCLNRLAAILPDRLGEYWQRLNPEGLAAPLLEYTGDEKVIAAALDFLEVALDNIPSEARHSLLGEETLQQVYRFSMDGKHPPFSQAAALELLRHVDGESFFKILQGILENTQSPDSLFIRRRCVRFIGEELEENKFSSRLEQLVNRAAEDPSPFVRQELTRTICAMPQSSFHRHSSYLALQDGTPQVRAAMLLQLADSILHGKEIKHGTTVLLASLNNETDVFVLRTAIKTAEDIAEGITRLSTTDARRFIQAVTPFLRKLHRECPHLIVRRSAARAGEKLWFCANPAIWPLKESIEQAAATIRPGRSKLFSSSSITADAGNGVHSSHNDHLLGRTMALVADSNYGLSLNRGRFWSEMQRGPEFRFRLWRLLSELVNASPDKRQAFSHTRGRYFHGRLHAPSNILAELTETKVPGEPLVIPEEDGWRPYLPLMDHLLSCLKIFGGSRKQYIYTPEGITEISPPAGVFRRIAARFKLTFGFRRYAAMRNWKEQDPEPPAVYIDAIRQLGFKIILQPYPQEDGLGGFEDPAVKRFFPAMMFPLSELFPRLKDYFVSIYENSFLELIIFTAAAVIIFVGRHLYLNARHRKMRRKIPLVMGGWGTRGKSGTERLKAALLNSQGFGVISKTTGSEATFLHAWPHGKLYEIPLFRPYDKASIWEQQDVTRIASGMDAEVFLWECMALQPDYVEVLQQGWMKDDIATITNAYPDHEDIMGPAGIDIPDVMARFIPRSSVLLTSEEQMEPVLREAANTVGTRTKTVGWLEAGLLTRDILDRFPYNEHPYNIALVLAVAKELGIPEDVALKEMADRTVPEIGMLKTFPTTQLNTRKLQFTNGMAANERIGFMSNWQRTGFAKQDHIAEPGVWLSTVVNNRADRIPRSRVFASILVNDISADRFFLIGNNLTGLYGYIKEAWEKAAHLFTLKPDKTGSNPGEHARHMLNAMAARFRVPVSETLIKTRLAIMLSAAIQTGSTTDSLLPLWNQPAKLRETLNNEDVSETLRDSIIEALESDLASVSLYREFADKIERINWEKTATEKSHHQLEKLDRDFNALLWSWFEKKIVVISDYHAPGDAVVQQICNETPPGFFNRIMGIQNIKGTGFDFVARWQAWEHCHRALNLIQSDDELDVEQGLSDLSTFTDYGLLSEEAVPNVITEFKQSSIAQSDRIQAQIMIIENQFERSITQLKARLAQGTRHHGLGTRLLDWLEGFLDAGDAVKRKKKANRIYEDLINQRISHPRAIHELSNLNKRQKGGWLSTQLHSTLNFFRR
jgi:gamma-polyglutamate synthase